MKKLVLIFVTVLLAGAFVRQNAAAQTVDISYAQDTSWSAYCSPPENVPFYGYIYSTGYANGDSITMDIDFGDGIDTMFKIEIYQNYYSSFYITHLYQTSGFFSVQYIATGPNGIADTVITIDEVYIGNGCGTLEGMAYFDNNGDCVFNSGDFPAEFVYIMAHDDSGNPNYLWTYPTSTGMYYLDVPLGLNYDLETVFWWGNYTVLCPAGGTYTNIAAPATGLDFAIQCTPGFDLVTNIWGWGFVPGANSYVNVSAFNNHCDTVQGVLKVVIDPQLTYSSATIPPTSINGDTLTWDPFTFHPSPWNYSTDLTIYTITSAAAQLGDSIICSVIAEPVSGDVDPLNNTSAFLSYVQSSWDPNAKDVNPKGAIAGNQVLDYNIQFQNTGTAPANNVYILDTIDTDLDMSTFSFIASSAPCDITFIGENVVRFYFHNINLPDSGSNEPASHGFVNYSISPKPGLADGTLINNTAAIYFDFNAAVITNTVTNIIDLSVGVEEVKETDNIHLYPNPAFNTVTIETNNNESIAIITDISGRVLKTVMLEGNKTEVDVSDFSEGMYLILVQSGDLVMKEKLVVIR